MSIVVSIDPGLTGAFAVIDHDGLRGVFDLPTMKIPNVGEGAMVQRKIDAHAFCAHLLKLCPAGEAKPTVVIEAVGTMGGANNAIQTQGSLLRSLGALETVGECLGWPVVYANAQTWKRWYGLINPRISDRERKALAMGKARTCFPACEAIARVKDHNRAEAILIGHWWYRHNVGDYSGVAELEAA